MNQLPFVILETKAFRHAQVHRDCFRFSIASEPLSAPLKHEVRAGAPQRLSQADLPSEFGSNELLDRTSVMCLN